MNRLRTIGRLRAGGASNLAPGPSLLLLFSGQSNAARRASKATTSYPSYLKTFNGAGEAIDRTDGITVTAALPASYFASVQAYSEFGVNSEGLAPGYSVAADEYATGTILTFTPAIGARHWRELMPGTGSWANLQQALTNGNRLLTARAATSIDVVNVIVHGEADADLVAPGGGSEGATLITQAEYKTIITDWVQGTQKAVQWCFADVAKTVTIAGMQPCTVSGDGMRVIHNAMVDSAQTVSGYNVIGPFYAGKNASTAHMDTDGVHSLGSWNPFRAEYMAYRIADIQAGNALPVFMTGATRVGATVTIAVNTIAAATLVIDTTTVPETTTSYSDSTNGFQARKVSDGSVVNVTGCSVLGTNITLTLASDPGEQVKILYAQQTWPGANQSVTGSTSKLARGNIRTTRSFTSAIDGTVTLYDWLCHQNITTDV